MARKKSVLVVSNDGTTYLLEEADNFDREVKTLGGSESFMKFLKKRSEEPGVISIGLTSTRSKRRVVGCFTYCGNWT